MSVEEARMNVPRVWVSSITFSDGQTVRLDANDRLLLIGPNNTGKSATGE